MLSDRARNLQSNFYPTFYNPLPFVVTSLFYRFDIRSARYRRIVSACASSRYQAHFLASIPGRVFAFITVRRTTRPGTSCLRMRQILMYNDP